jgi:hypothetical protein
MRGHEPTDFRPATFLALARGLAHLSEGYCLTVFLGLGARLFFDPMACLGLAAVLAGLHAWEAGEP